MLFKPQIPWPRAFTRRPSGSSLEFDKQEGLTRTLQLNSAIKEGWGLKQAGGFIQLGVYDGKQA